MNPLELQPGTHFWAKSTTSEGDLLLMMMRNENDYRNRPVFTVCGPWECEFFLEQFEVIEVVPAPKGCENMPLYYR